MTEPVVLIDKLLKVYDGVTAVDHLSLAVAPGEIFGLLGPNGAGKTTTIRILMDIIKPDEGIARVLGELPGVARERVGYLPEERGLYRGLRVDETLVYLAQLKGMARARAAKRVTELLERVELGEWAKRKMQELSRGMHQKVQLIASIIHDPALVVLDEPFQGLDPVNVGMVKDLIRDLRAQGKTIVLSAHEMSHVESLCERIALMNRGRSVLYGDLADIKKRFAPHALDISPVLALNGWPEVAQAEIHDNTQRVYLAPGVLPRAFLKKILDQGLNVERFETATMPLEQIFIQVVKGDDDSS